MANRPSNSLWDPIFCSGWRCERARRRLQVSILQRKCEKQCQDGANKPSNSLWKPIFCSGWGCHRERHRLQVSILQGKCEKRRQDRSPRACEKIDHRTVCGNQFCVKDSAVSKNTRCHAHSCPVCSTVVWSSQSCGRIAATHVTPSGKRCQTKHWHVPDKKEKKRKK